MRIALLGPVLPFRGGISHFNTTMAEKFVLNGHQVRAFSFVRQYPKLFFPGNDQYCEDQPKTDFKVVNTLTPYSPLTWLRTGWEIKRWNPDVLIIQYWIPFFAPSFIKIINILKTITKIRIVYLIHNIEFHEKWPMAKILTKMALKRADYYITLSNSVKASLIKLLPNIKYSRIFTVKHPVFETCSKPENVNCWDILKVPKKDTILFFGFIKPYKGVDVLINAMPGVVDYFESIDREIQLIIAGEVYGDDEVYRNLIKQNGLEEVVIFHNKYISQENISCYFSISDITVLPYKSATQSGVVLLSYSFSKPVIVTRVGGLDEFVDEGLNGFIVQPDNPADLAGAIIKFYKNNLKNTMMSNLKQDQKKRFSWEPLIRTIESIE